jgi:pilus assembly protein CpaF
MLSCFIPEHERVITIEDAAELQLSHSNLVRLETRMPNVEGHGAVRQRQLLINCLRMRPDRIIIGGVRGEEAFDMLSTMNTGHEGSLGTIHSNSPRDALMRLESMVSMSNANLPEKSIRHQIAAAITLIVQVSRMCDRTRKVVSISEITGQEGDVISMHEVFSFVKKGIAANGKVLGAFQPSRIRPRFVEQLKVAGINLPDDLFNHTLEVN